MPENHTKQAADSRQFGLRDVAPGVFLLFLLLLFYWPAIHGTFVFDDDRLTTLPELRSLHGLWRIWFSPPQQFSYYPVMHTIMWVEHRIWGDSPVAYHLMNLFLHAVVAFLVVAVMKRLALPGAWLAAFIFALHPVNAESVAWISEQKNMLSTMFYLATILVWLRFDADRKVRWYALATGLFAMAILCKTTAGMLPVTLLAIAWWRTGRVDWKRDVLPLLPWCAAVIVLGRVSGGIEHESYDTNSADFTLSLWQHCMLASREVWFYAWKLLWPVNLMFNYPRWQVDAGNWQQWLYPAGLLAVAAIFFLLARRNRGPLACLVFFTANLFPVMGFIYVDWFMFSFVADHFQYVACLGIIVPLAAGLGLAADKAGVAGRWSIRVASGILIFTLSALTWRQSHMYQDMETFYRQITHDNPGSGMAHYNFGLVLLQIPGHHTEAMGEMDEALRLKPDDVKLNDRIAQIFLDAQRDPEAQAALERSLKINPNDAFAHYLYGSALLRIPERRAEAITHLQASVKLKPDEVQPHIALATVLLATGRAQDSIVEYQAALRINPNLPDAHAMLGNALAASPGRMQDAIAEYQQSLQLNADAPEVHFWLGNALATLPDRKQEAIVQFEEALRLDPSLFKARHMLRQLQDDE